MNQNCDSLGVGMGTPLDWDGVGSETATGSSAADDSVEGSEWTSHWIC